MLPIKALMHAFVKSRIEYSYCLLYGLPAIQINKGQCVLNDAVRLVSWAPRHCHVTHSLRDLHWLPVRERIKYKILLLTFKTIRGREVASLFLRTYFS